MSEAMTVTVTDFLLARIAEDEAQAEGGYCHRDDQNLAECRSKRRIVGRHNLWHVCPNADGSGDTDYSPGDGDIGMRPCPTMLDLAAVYSSHPDYREEWRRDA